MSLNGILLTFAILLHVLWPMADVAQAETIADSNVVEKGSFFDNWEQEEKFHVPATTRGRVVEGESSLDRVFDLGKQITDSSSLKVASADYAILRNAAGKYDTLFTYGIGPCVVVIFESDSLILLAHLMTEFQSPPRKTISRFLQYFRENNVPTEQIRARVIGGLDGSDYAGRLIYELQLKLVTIKEIDVLGSEELVRAIAVTFRKDRPKVYRLVP